MNKRIAYLLLLCLAALMLLTGCYSDADPVTDNPSQPSAITAPADDSVQDMTQTNQSPENIKEPGGSSDPGING